MNCVTRGLFTVALLAIWAVPARAQAVHEGFWISFGLGAGLDLDNDTRAGGAAYVRLGGSATQQLLIGGELSGWAREEGAVTVARGNATATLIFYPSLKGGLLLKTGLGFGSVTAAVQVGNTTTTVSDEGLGVSFGTGYDFKVGTNFFLTPNLDLLVQRISGSTRSLLLFTLGATWH